MKRLIYVSVFFSLFLNSFVFGENKTDTKYTEIFSTGQSYGEMKYSDLRVVDVEGKIKFDITVNKSDYNSILVECESCKYTIYKDGNIIQEKKPGFTFNELPSTGYMVISKETLPIKTVIAGTKIDWLF